MVYVRSKRVKGNMYYYLVKSVREGDRVRQVTLDYLGAEKPDTCELIRLKKSYG
ncbi:MAG: hypothetical protein U9Q22_05955 [Candidatus Altiarchaeota archaeon]|nr:hypothetical protein [Candidatus Altiarchaeota archaeon]